MGLGAPNGLRTPKKGLPVEPLDEDPEMGNGSVPRTLLRSSGSQRASLLQVDLTHWAHTGQTVAMMGEPMGS